MNTRTDLIHTTDFIKEFLPKGARILEVGCGRGELAACLGENGFQVTAIDASPEAVEIARRNDVLAQIARLEEFETEEKFDAVLFSRSLHHMDSLDAALAKAKALLDQRGRVIVEDFGIEEMDEKTSDWFYELWDFVAMLVEPSRFSENPSGIMPLERWRKQHQHEPALHTRKAMLRALETKIGNVYKTPAPYLYRYFIDSFESVRSNPMAAQRFFDLEKKQIDAGRIQPIGLRIVAKKYFSYLK